MEGKNGLQRLGPLGGDSMLRMTQGRMQSIIQDVQITESDIKRIIELGVEFNRAGTLAFNQDKFKKILTENPKRVVQFLRGNLVDVGFIPNLTNKLKSLTVQGTGVISSRKKNFQDRANQVDQRIDRKEKSLEKREEQLRRQFSKMEETMSKINSQAGALGGMGKG